MRTGLQQDAFDLGKSSFPGVLKWCNANAVSEIDVGFVIDEQLHNLLVCFAAIAENNCLQ